MLGVFLGTDGLIEPRIPRIYPWGVSKQENNEPC